jgi:hypothetical protein
MTRFQKVDAYRRSAREPATGPPQHFQTGYLYRYRVVSRADREHYRPSTALFVTQRVNSYHSASNMPRPSKGYILVSYNHALRGAEVTPTWYSVERMFYPRI